MDFLNCESRIASMSDKVSMLLVDDEPLIRKSGKWLIENKGFRCIIAGNEAEAVKKIENGFIPEVALIDFLIPVGNITRERYEGELHGLTGGLRLAKFIQQETNGRCRTILVTGLMDYRIHAQEGGVWGYCSKPVEDWDLLIEILGKGFLESSEMGKPTIDVDIEIRKLQGKER